MGVILDCATPLIRSLSLSLSSVLSFCLFSAANHSTASEAMSFIYVDEEQEAKAETENPDGTPLRTYNSAGATFATHLITNTLVHALDCLGNWSHVSLGVGATS